jgi:hypothetical protein
VAHSGSDRARLDVGGDVRDLVVAEGDVQQDPVDGRVGQRAAAEMLGVAVRLAAVPQDLQEVVDQWPFELVWVLPMRDDLTGASVDVPASEALQTPASSEPAAGVQVARARAPLERLFVRWHQPPGSGELQR